MHNFNITPTAYHQEQIHIDFYLAPVKKYVVKISLNNWCELLSLIIFKAKMRYQMKFWTFLSKSLKIKLLVFIICISLLLFICLIISSISLYFNQFIHLITSSTSLIYFSHTSMLDHHILFRFINDMQKLLTKNKITDGCSCDLDVLKGSKNVDLSAKRKNRQ